MIRNFIEDHICLNNYEGFSKKKIKKEYFIDRIRYIQLMYQFKKKVYFSVTILIKWILIRYDKSVLEIV